MRDLREDNALPLVIFADSTKIPPPLGKLQSLRGLRTAPGMGEQLQTREGKVLEEEQR